MDESHKSSPQDQLGVFTYQSLTLIRILVVCSVTLNRFQCNESQCLTPKSPSPGVEPGTWGWGPQILIYFINRHCSPPKCFPVRELNAALEGGTCGWSQQILIQCIDLHCSCPKPSKLRDSNPGLVVESHKSSPLDQLGVFTYQSLTLMRILIICSNALNRFQSNRKHLLDCKIVHSPRVELGSCGWKPKTLTARPTGTVHSSILNYDALVGHLFCCIAVNFQLIKGLAGLQNFSQSGSRTRDLGVGLEREISKS